MTNQTVEPPNKPPPASSGPATGGRTRSAPYAAVGTPPPRRSGLLLLVLLLLIAAAFALLVLSPDVVRQLISPFVGSPPSATISVAPPPSRSDPALPAPQGPAPSSSEPSSPSAPAAGPSSLDRAVASELQTLRTMLADVTGRLGEIERKTASGDDARAGDLANRLNAVEARLAALIEQPAVTPTMLSDALIENRQSTQAAAQEAAQEAARHAVGEAAQAEVRAAVQSAMKDMSSTLADLDKRTAGLEKNAGAAAAVADLEKRVTGLEKMASAVAAVVDLERRMAALEKATAAVIAIPDLERRVTGMEKTTAPLAAQSRAALQGESLALGLLALRTALDHGAPYADVVSTLRVAAAADDVLVAEVDRLAPAAVNGLPTLAMLRQRLSALSRIEASAPPQAAAPEPAPASETAAVDQGFWAEIWQRLTSVVTVRRLDVSASQPGTAPGEADPVIDRALARLAVDDLAGAIALLDDESARRTLSETQLVALDDWLRDGRARLSAETAFANLARRSLALYSTKPEMMAPGDASLQQ